ncbi:MAG TPA: class I SAM-dependent methyltransferase [Gemmatimonadaceae bacterium]|nr:class I SAM-dependent methyltransferase [Gemmatimonadaceae bacterium]
MAQWSEPERIAAYYEGQADRYDAVMEGDPHNARVRDAFRTLVASMVPAAGRLLDFGCGTGVDARWYAARGYPVVAYDPARRMIAQASTRCAREIMAGQIEAVTFPFAEFPHALPAHAGFDAIVTNFAVLNLLSDLRELFEGFARVVVPGGLVIANVLSPVHWRDLRYGWWWRGLLGSVGTGTLSVRWPETSTHRHFMPTIARAAAPAFTVVERRDHDGRFGQFRFLVLRRAT